MLGDDDGTTARILDVVAWMKENRIEAAMTSPTYYQWPDAYSAQGAVLRYRMGTGDFSVKNTKDILNKCLKDGLTWRDGMPGVYHGIVERKTLDRIFARCGTYYPGPSPDIANCVSVCLTTDRYGWVDAPIIINGVGRNHGGGKYRENIELRKLPFLPDDIIENWEPRIPKAWTATTIWCESAIKVLRAMGREDLIEEVNLEYMYAVFISLYFSHRRLATQLSDNKLSLSLNLLSRSMRSFLKRLETRFDKKRKAIPNVRNIHEAVAHLSAL